MRRRSSAPVPASPPGTQVQHDTAVLAERGAGEPGVAARSVDQQLADDVAAGADGLGDAAGFQCRPRTAAAQDVAASRRSVRRDLAEQSLGGGVSRGEPPLGVEDHDAGGQMLQHSRGWELRGHGQEKRRRSRKPAPIAETFRAVDTGALLTRAPRPSAGVDDWLAVLGLLALLTFALTWLSAGLGLVTKNVEGASNAALPLQFLPFLGSAIVPADSMPAGLRWFAENQPFTPIIETLRALLTGGDAGATALLAVTWCVVLALAGYMWARVQFER